MLSAPPENNGRHLVVVGKGHAMGSSVPLEGMLADASDQLMMYYLLRTKMWPVKEPVDLQLFDGDDEE